MPYCPSNELCHIPGYMDKTQTPQMVLFTYSGPLNIMTRTWLEKIFPKTFTNPNGCPIAITTFVITQEEDPCSVRLVHARGHEIALSGMTRTSRVDNWNEKKWNDSIIVQLKTVSNTSMIDEADLAGVRAQNFYPGNNSQFLLLNKNSFVYDSSLLVQQFKDVDDTVGYYWPFEMKKKVLDRLTCLDRCPNDTFDGLWEIPGSRLFTSEHDKLGCIYLDQCFEGVPSADGVYNLLKYNLDQTASQQRAPLQINIRDRHLSSLELTAGIQRFISSAQQKDTWFVTMRELIQWVKHPIAKNHLKKGFWNCRFTENVKCTEQSDNSTIKKVTFAAVINVQNIWIWQTVFLVVFYIVIYRYDKYMQEKKKK